MNKQEQIAYFKSIPNGVLISELEDIGQRLARQDNVTWAKRMDEDILSFRRIKNELYRRLEGLDEYPPT